MVQHYMLEIYLHITADVSNSVSVRHIVNVNSALTHLQTYYMYDILSTTSTSNLLFTYSNEQLKVLNSKQVQKGKSSWIGFYRLLYKYNNNNIVNNQIIVSINSTLIFASPLFYLLTHKIIIN